MSHLDLDDLDVQIAQLEALKKARLAKAEAEARERDREAAKVLIQSTPTKAKPSAIDYELPEAPSQPKFSSARAGPSRPQNVSLPSLPSSQSNFAAALARRRTDDGEERIEHHTAPTGLRIGPGEFGLDPDGGAEWRALEPNSGIRLSKRAMPHAEVQDLLRRRYYLDPLRVYSLARLNRDGATYNVPVNKEWATIAVVAERSDVRASGGKAGDAGDDVDFEEQEEIRRPSKTASKGKGKAKAKAQVYEKRAPRKYISITLVSLPSRSRSGKAEGDARFQLLLFEADVTHRKGGEPSYRGGSGGAYEKWSNLAVGSVIAIVNPRILRPLKSGATPHPLSLPLALNPTSATSITYIGHAQDVGRCAARKRDGTQCSTWVDTRQDDLCEHHQVEELKRGRAGRGELASATSALEGMYRSDNRAGVRATPRGEDSGATYVLGAGKVVRTGQRGPAPVQAPSAKRRREEQAAARASLARILERTDDNSPGAKYLRAAEAERGRAKAGAGEVGEAAPARRQVFSPAAITAIGFDPSRQPEQSARRAALIASLRKPVDRTALNKRHKTCRDPSPDMIDLD
ncbi:hypothetical protein CC85DRAFT_10243 [Cutaneotrichosporon oleaginosum]|uniref:Zinc finger Mcm10/DnaG-type domain-containing protein n=1 Tax=Cutaneotrichosporon oleaginosum TaxID=879819 RepID=A0A0J0XU88_9TREE|nr:uncharacterized protein CC85DRAFT_10243 [Cutaneotrichosporon oleaginosum]KLT44612.1 hypothetical protein CC85DRAFT_10243 [Cutaneotrichosporon oleaginosum]TXT13873.1 hypothetical protein COLE_00066 [Cutaneotrichosporon oleaginosum]